MENRAAAFKVGAEGGILGPDLTSIQRDRSAHDLLEAIVYPSVSFVREYETYRVKTKTGEHTGIIQQQTATAIVLGTSQATDRKSTRLNSSHSTLSRMPSSA